VRRRHREATHDLFDAVRPFDPDNPLMRRERFNSRTQDGWVPMETELVAQSRLKHRAGMTSVANALHLFLSTGLAHWTRRSESDPFAARKVIHLRA
jgi:hypothetical protein